MLRKAKQTTYHIMRVVEYSSFFKGESPIDICSTLKRFKRTSLIRTATILSLHYGNYSIPDGKRTLFSESSKKHVPYLNKMFNAFYQREKIAHGEKIEILTYRTSLELWRQIFAIRAEEYTNNVKEEDVEILLFKVLLTINEKIVKFKERKEQYKLDELLFLNGFLTNDGNKYDLQAILQPQMYYFQQLVDFIPTNEVLSRASAKLLCEWGIESWQQYYITIFIIANQTDKYKKNGANGVPIITPHWLEQNKDSGFLSLSLMEHLYIDEEEYIPYIDEDVSQRELNIDYRRFRSKPFVKLKDGTGYVVINNQLLCERLFNSLYFDFMPLISGSKNSCGFFDYNRDFIEKVLFRNTFFNCIHLNSYTFPKRNADRIQERPHEPDFYARSKRGELIIVECKAIKINGECRDDGDYARLLDELHEKIVLKTKNLDKTRREFKREPIPQGVGQLVHHIVSIDSDSFEWDKNIPDDVAYYPLLVFEDVKLVQTGILSMVNRWFYEELGKNKDLFISEALMPIMVVSINTLYLYDNLLRRRGLTKVIDAFVEENAQFDSVTGQYMISETADFDEYLRRYPFKKSGDATKWLKKKIDEFKVLRNKN